MNRPAMPRGAKLRDIYHSGDYDCTLTRTRSAGTTRALDGDAPPGRGRGGAPPGRGRAGSGGAASQFALPDRESTASWRRAVTVAFCHRQIPVFASPRRPEGSHACRSESIAGLDAPTKSASAQSWPTAVAQNETHDSYLDAGRRFCNQSQRYHRYAVNPAEQETYTKNQ